MRVFSEMSNEIQVMGNDLSLGILLADAITALEVKKVIESRSDILRCIEHRLASYKKMQKKLNMDISEEVGEPVLVWPFDSAPESLRKLSDNGGDEDWLVLVRPNGMRGMLSMYVPAWIEKLGNDVDRYDLEDGSTVFIGSHA